MFGTLHLRNLKVLKLNYIATAEEELVAFLRRYGNTLEVLEIRRIKLMAGAWFSALPRLHGIINVGSIHHVSFEGGLYECEDGSSPPARFRAYNFSQPRAAGRLREYLVNGGDCPVTQDTDREWELDD
ncbi:hypothetical protein BU16DRAFT_543530 [Lophium mytilinum]|uniref:F-box domain-containing protein n=1 Tax=Lophium mytilinum TaxID=390894 RepID=A0A6A6QD38_9PEZI|nr:hypothetical protein BU16DRAFT_543530 [Lophium mytilinum]